MKHIIAAAALAALCACQMPTGQEADVLDVLTGVASQSDQIIATMGQLEAATTGIGQAVAESASLPEDAPTDWTTIVGGLGAILLAAGGTYAKAKGDAVKVAKAEVHMERDASRVGQNLKPAK